MYIYISQAETADGSRIRKSISPSVSSSGISSGAGGSSKITSAFASASRVDAFEPSMSVICWIYMAASQIVSVFEGRFSSGNSGINPRNSSIVAFRVCTLLRSRVFASRLCLLIPVRRRPRLLVRFFASSLTGWASIVDFITLKMVDRPLVHADIAAVARLTSETSISVHLPLRCYHFAVRETLWFRVGGQQIGSREHKFQRVRCFSQTCDTRCIDIVISLTTVLLYCIREVWCSSSSEIQYLFPCLYFEWF